MKQRAFSKLGRWPSSPPNTDNSDRITRDEQYLVQLEISTLTHELLHNTLEFSWTCSDHDENISYFTCNVFSVSVLEIPYRPGLNNKIIGAVPRGALPRGALPRQLYRKALGPLARDIFQSKNVSYKVSCGLLLTVACDSV